MNIHLIAIHYKDNSKKDIVGFRLLDSDNGQVMDQPYNAVANVVNSKKVKIHGITPGNKLKGSNGSFDRYPAFVNNNIISNSLVILASIDDKGFVVSNFEGKFTSATIDETLTYSNKVGIANGKVVTKDGKQYISAINGTYENRPASSDARFKNIGINREYAADLKESIKKSKLKTGNDVRFARVVTGTPNPNSKLKELDEDTGMTVEQKMAYTLLALKHVRPFYYSIFNTIRRIEANEEEIDTMAVSLDTLYFSSNFIKSLPLQELLFVYIHEICHIAMKHRIREKGREHDVWNQACDYYINKCIADDFGLKEIGDVVDAQSRIENAVGTRYKIGLPANCLFNSNINIDTDTPEKIYEELMSLANQTPDSGDGEDEGGDGDDQNQNSQSGSGGSKSNKQKNKQSNSGENSSDEQNESNGQNESDGKDEDNNSENGSSSNVDENGSSNSEGNGKDKREGRLIGKEFRGQEITKTDTDMVDDNRSKGQSQDQMNQTATSLLNRAVTVHRQTHQFGGDTADFLERYVEKALAPKINWVALLKNKLTRASQKVNTFAAPDRRFRSRNMIMPGPKALENDALESIKICIDTSGSISSKDIGIALTQIDQLFSKFKADAELLYWDTRIRAIYPFKNPKELVSKKPMGGGGTDANCIFEYFETDRDYKIGRKKKPSIIVVFTDGYFGKLEDKYKKYRDVIWVVQGNDYFEPPFGVKAPFKNED